jgi:hypothetical protein
MNSFMNQKYAPDEQRHEDDLETTNGGVWIVPPAKRACPEGQKVLYGPFRWKTGDSPDPIWRIGGRWYLPLPIWRFG